MEKKRHEQEERKKELKDKKQRFKELLEERMREMNENTRKIVNKTPLFKKIEKDYQENVLMPELDRQKKRLSSL